MSAAPPVPAAPAAKKPFPVAKVAIGFAVMAGLVLLFRLLPLAAWIEEFKTYVRGQGTLGYVIFALVYIGVSLIPAGPAAIMTLAAGAVYGVVTGTILVSLSSITAATLAFLLARGIFRQRVQKIAESNRRFAIHHRVCSATIHCSASATGRKTMRNSCELNSIIRLEPCGGTPAFRNAPDSGEALAIRRFHTS